MRLLLPRSPPCPYCKKKVDMRFVVHGVRRLARACVGAKSGLQESRWFLRSELGPTRSLGDPGGLCFSLSLSQLEPLSSVSLNLPPRPSNCPHTAYKSFRERSTLRTFKRYLL